MIDLLKQSLWQQFGGTFNMFENAMNLFPENLWNRVLWDDPDDIRYGKVWWIAYHTLSWTDLFLNGTSEGFSPPAPFVRGVLPDTPYTKAGIMGYYDHCRQKCQTTINNLTPERASEICEFPWMQPSFYELQLYSIRHVQEHTAQLNLFLGQHGIEASDWSANADDKAS